MGPTVFRLAQRRHDRWRVPIAVRVLRRPAVWWAATIIVALVAAMMVGNLHSAAKRNRDAWGTPTTVLVATNTIEAGAAIGEQFSVAQWPQALVPAGAIDTVDPAAVAAAPIFEGEPLIAPRLSGSGAGLGARIPSGRSAVAVSALLIPTGLAVGDRVDLVATFPSGVAQHDGVVASAAVVIDVDEDQVTVAVTPDEVSATATAITRGTLTMLVNGA